MEEFILKEAMDYFEEDTVYICEVSSDFFVKTLICIAKFQGRTFLS